MAGPQAGTGRGGQVEGTVPKRDDHDWQGHVRMDRYVLEEIDRQLDDFILKQCGSFI